MSTIKGIFEPFDPNIVDQLNKRKEILSTRGGSNPELFYAYTTQKQCIIRMVSGVDLRESANEELLEPDEKGKKLDNNLAKQYILEGGTKSNEDFAKVSTWRERPKSRGDIHRKFNNYWDKREKEGGLAKTKRVYESNTRSREEEQPYIPLYITFCDISL